MNIVNYIIIIIIILQEITNVINPLTVVHFLYSALITWTVFFYITLIISINAIGTKPQ